ncbi:MAG: hypothetical protein ABIH88_02285, partial [Patescibacteria group bacterium]
SQEEVEGKIPDRFNIVEHITGELSPEEDNLLGRIREFAEETSAVFEKSFSKELRSYRKEGRISFRITDFLKEKRFKVPKFEIFDKESGELKLEELGFDYQIEEGSFLLLFQLPKPLAQFWSKAGNSLWGEDSKDIDSVIGWGHFYRKLMPAVWKKQGFFENEKNLSFRKINDIGQHDPKEYYYLWRVKSWQRK